MSLNLDDLIIYDGKDGDGFITGLITDEELPKFKEIFEHNLPINYYGTIYFIHQYKYTPHEQLVLFHIRLKLIKIRD